MKTPKVFVGLLLFLLIASPLVLAAPLPDNESSGTLSGKVTNAVSGVGIPWVQIQIFPVDPPGTDSWIQVLTDLSGNYNVTLDAGTYVLHAQPPYVSGSPYVGEWYDNAADSAHATHVVIAGGANVVANFALNRETPSGAKGTISGTVKAADSGLPLANVVIHFTNLSFPLTQEPDAVTDNAGHYEASLDVGPYILQAVPPAGSGYASAWFDGVSDPFKATAVTVEEGKSVAADFSLEKSGTVPTGRGVIAGTVVDNATKAPLSLVSIRFFSLNAETDCWQGTITDENGKYRAELSPGSYLVEAVPLPNSGYSNLWYENAASPENATKVVVSENSTFTADFALAKKPVVELFTIEGIVKDGSGNPLENVRVAIVRTIQDMNELFTASGTLGAWTQEVAQIEGLGECLGVVWIGKTDASGHYKASVAGGNSYYAMATAPGYVPQFYNKKTNPLDADPIVVQASVTGIDFALDQIAPAVNSISGSVRDAGGKGVRSGIVLFPLPLLHSGMLGRYGVTDSIGEYAISGIAAGDYLVLAVPFDGYAPTFYKEGVFGVIGWQNADTVSINGAVSAVNIGVVPIHIKGIAHLSGRIVSKAGIPLSSVRVACFDHAGDVVGCALTDDQGNYALEMVPAGAVNVVADLPDFSSASVPVNVGAEAYSVSVEDIALTPTGTTSVGQGRSNIPDAFMLHQNYPNPFNPSTTIQFDMPVSGEVSVRVYDVLGQEVRTLIHAIVNAGRTQITWDGRDDWGHAVSTGVYLYKMTVSQAGGTGSFSQVRRMVLTK